MVESGSHIRGYADSNYDYSTLQTWKLSEISDVCRFRCLQLCLQVGECLGFFLQQESKMCHLSSFDYISTATAIYSPPAVVLSSTQWIYYHVVKDCMESKCPSEFGYTLIPEICFCIKWYEDIVFHSLSKEFCRHDGAQLVRIDSLIKQLYINDYLSQVEPNPVSAKFIQGELVNGKWLYDDGTEMSYFNWLPGKPAVDDTYYILNIVSRSDYMWKNIRDIFERSFICEIDLQN
ncbi:MRC [Mytilus coruscus]|uniref:MRC n=1 Tax=Mytilus coruscus TaxID=42192 RepID=A0A6J8B1E6_MYTCO|nr:MRC [Mytilus coruscus]